MKNALENGVDIFQSGRFNELLGLVVDLQTKLNPIKYSCIGCSYCYAAEAENNLNDLDPKSERSDFGDFAISTSWPPVAGEYYELNSYEYIEIK